MPSAWIYQDDKQVKKHGAEMANWYVGWIAPTATNAARVAAPASKGVGTPRMCGRIARPS